MKMPLLSLPLLLSACATAGAVATSPPDLIVAYRDLALDTTAGRAELVRRTERAVRYFCAAYDPEDETAIFDVRLASTRLCPGAAARMLRRKMPASVRRAYRAGVEAIQNLPRPPKQ
ncbi:UrcA family protein [Sphingomonas zeae]